MKKIFNCPNCNSSATLHPADHHRVHCDNLTCRTTGPINDENVHKWNSLTNYTDRQDRLDEMVKIMAPAMMKDDVFWKELALYEDRGLTKPELAAEVVVNQAKCLLDEVDRQSA